jgi:hypothetical protein
MSVIDESIQSDHPQSLRPNIFLKIGCIIYLIALAGWSSTLYFLILRKAFSHESFMHAVKILTFIDFSKFYVAGLIAWSADKSKLYDFPTQMLWVQNVLGPLDHAPDSIPYTPMFCVLMRVFTWLPIEKALLLAFFSLFSLALLSVTAILIQKGNLKKSECFVFWILALTPISVAEVFQLGQSTFFWLATMATFYGCFLKKKDVFSGIALAFLALKPQYAILATAAPIGAQRWKILLAAAVTEIALILLATCVIGLDTMIYYPKFLNFAGGHVTSFIPNHNPSLAMITLRGLLQPLLPEELNFHISSVINCLVWIPLLFVWRRCTHIGCEAFSWAIALTVTCTIFFSAHSMLYDFMLTSIGFAVTLKFGELSWQFSTDDKLKRVWVAMFWLLPGFTWLVSGLHASYETSVKTHSILLLCIIGIATLNLAKIFKKPAAKIV